MDVFRNRNDVIVLERQGWHAALCASAVHDRNDLFTTLIREHDLRPKKVRPTCHAASEIGAVARNAVHGEELLPALDQEGVSRRTLLRRKHGRLARRLLLHGGRWLLPRGLGTRTGHDAGRASERRHDNHPGNVHRFTSKRRTEW